MDYRLTLEERCLIASELRACLLRKENPRRLDSICDPETKPGPLAERAYAFEFFLDRYRSDVRTGMENNNNIDFQIEWTTTSIERDEEIRTRERIARMTVEIFMNQAIEGGGLDEMVDKLSISEYEECEISTERLKLFLFEIFYELVREFARIKAEPMIK